MIGQSHPSSLYRPEPTGGLKVAQTLERLFLFGFDLVAQSQDIDAAPASRLIGWSPSHRR